MRENISEQAKLAMVQFFCYCFCFLSKQNDRTNNLMSIKKLISVLRMHEAWPLLTWNINEAIEMKEQNLLKVIRSRIFQVSLNIVKHWILNILHAVYVMLNICFKRITTDTQQNNNMENSSNKSCIWMKWSIVCNACGKPNDYIIYNRMQSM